MHEEHSPSFQSGLAYFKSNGASLEMSPNSSMNLCAWMKGFCLGLVSCDALLFKYLSIEQALIYMDVDSTRLNELLEIAEQIVSKEHEPYWPAIPARFEHHHQPSVE